MSAALTCAQCGSEAVIPLDGDYDFWRCLDCDHLFVADDDETEPLSPARAKVRRMHRED
jgi:hypothetical protein